MKKSSIKVATISDAIPELPFPLCFTETAFAGLEAVACRPPETGAMGFCPFDRFGIDTVEFDANGSARSTSSVYAPDNVWAEKRRAHWLGQAQPKWWVTSIHSHPGGIGRPSEAVGTGLGDLGFVAAVFAENEALQYFAVPILTETGTDEPQLYPWVAERGENGAVKLLKATVHICPVDEFPPAVFNPDWKRRIERAPLDAQEVARLIEGDARLTSKSEFLYELVTLRRGVVLRLEIPHQFPAIGPRIFLPVLDGVPLIAPQGWRQGGKGTPEERIAKLVKETVKWLARAS